MVHINKVDCYETTRGIFRLIENQLHNGRYIGTKLWSDPGGYQHEEDVYEFTNNQKTIWASTVEWENQYGPNRIGIISTIPNQSNYLSQIFEMTIPYSFSKRNNTRAFEDTHIIEIRNYGRFTIGKRGLKREVFFNYLKENGLENEISYDEENKEYLKVIEFDKSGISNEYFYDRLINITYLIKEFKDYFRELYKRND